MLRTSGSLRTSSNVVLPASLGGMFVLFEQAGVVILAAHLDRLRLRFSINTHTRTPIHTHPITWIVACCCLLSFVCSCVSIRTISILQSHDRQTGLDQDGVLRLSHNCSSSPRQQTTTLHSFLHRPPSVHHPQPIRQVIPPIRCPFTDHNPRASNHLCQLSSLHMRTTPTCPLN